MSTERLSKLRPLRPRRLGVCLIFVVLLAMSGWLLEGWLTGSELRSAAVTETQADTDDEIEKLFANAVLQMQERNYGRALRLWHRALVLDPNIPEIKVNMGFTLFELGDYDTAHSFFRDAIEQDAYQANAYYGLALVEEKTGDLSAAVGAMRSYIHLARDDAAETFVRKARAALWEWEERLSSGAEIDAAGN